MRSFWSDLQFAVRMMAKSPAFTAVAILSLALGIGANTAIFSLVDSVLLRMLPVSHPEQLMFVNTNEVQSGSFRISRNISSAALKQMQNRAKSVAGVTATQVHGWKVNVGVNGQSELASGNLVAGNYYSVLGVPSTLGRTIGVDDDRPDGRVALVSFGYWQRRFGADTGVVGRRITVNSVPFTIIGVTPREFYGVSADYPAELMIPAQTLPQVRAGRVSSEAPKERDGAGSVIVRLKPGVAIRDAANELSGIFRQAELEHAGTNAEEIASIQKSSIELAPASQGFSSARNRFSEPLKVLMVVTAMVMLIACANIANLLLAKASARRREIAIRLSLGSSRWRLVRQLLTESLLLAILGGVVGIGIAAWAREGIIYLAGTEAGATIPSEWNVRVLGFTAAVCLLNALLFGIAPALRATGIDFAEALKSARSGRMAGKLPLARILVAAQVALSLALLVGAALFLGTFRNLDRVDLGYDRDHALMVAIDPSLAGYKKAQAGEIYRQVLERAGSVRGVRSVSLIQSRLLGGMLQLSGVSVPGYTLQKGEDSRNLWVIVHRVGANFLTVSGMHLLAGRDFSERDNSGAENVAVINETMAKHFFGGRDAIGQHISWGNEQKPTTVVGVVRDFKTFGMQDDKQDAAFLPFLQGEVPANSTVLVRTTVDPARVAADVRAAIRSVDSKLPQYDVTTMDAQVEKALTQERLLAMLATAFGLLALALAAIGLYGVLSYGVAQRTGEIGVRMALGAERGRILRMILSETARIIAIGMVVGVGVAIAGARAVEKMLYGVKPADAWSLGIAAGVLGVVALIAGWLPARRAARIEAMVALREE